MVSKSPFYGWKNAWLLFFIYMANTGLVFYAYTVIFPVMVQETGWSRGDASIAHSLNMLLLGLLVPLVAIILNRIGSRKSIIIGLVILLSGLFLLGTLTSRFWHWMLIWGVLVPAGQVLSGFLPIQVTVMFWFNRKRATALGLVMTSAGVGGFIAQPVYTWFMQVTRTWQTGWLLSGGFTLLALILSFWVRSKPADMGQYPDGISPGEAEAYDAAEKKAVRTYRTSSVWTVREVFKTPTIWFFIAVGITQVMPIIFITSHGVLHITDMGYTSMQAAYVLMFMLLGSGLARFPMGWVGDRIEPRWIATGALSLMLIAFIGIWRAPNLNILMGFGPLFGICYGTLLVIMSTMMGNYYGPESYASINAVTAPFLTIISASIPTVAGYIADKQGSYNLMFIVLTIGLIISVICSTFLSPPKKPI